MSRNETSTIHTATGKPVTMTGEFNWDRSRATGRDWWSAVVEYTDCDGWGQTRVVGGSARGASAARKIAAEWVMSNANWLCE